MSDKKIQPKAKENTSRSVSGRTKALVCVAAAIVVVAVIALVVVFSGGQPSNAAAKVGNTYITEDQVTEKIEEYRKNYSLTDDSDFASFLKYYGQTVSQFRESAINEIATELLVEDRAKELGISVSDQEVDAYYNQIKGDNDTSEGSAWANALESIGMTEDTLKQRYKYIVLQDKVFAADVPERDATDDEVLSYAQTYLSGTIQMHVAHIVIKGDDAATRADACYQAIVAARDAGTLNASTFADFARQYSDEENVQQTGGAVGWTGSGLISSDVLEIMSEDDEAEIGEGTLFGLIESSEEQGSYEIAYVDEAYTVPTVSSGMSVADLGAPDGLLEAIRTAAKEEAYTSDCSSYLTKLLEAASVQYYSMPSNAPYNVSLS